MVQSVSKLRSMSAPSDAEVGRTRAILIASIVVTVALYAIPYGHYIAYPLMLLSTLAHEMGHAVIDHYFVIRPPSKVAEMLCEYVDKEISSQPF